MCDTTMIGTTDAVPEERSGRHPIPTLLLVPPTPAVAGVPLHEPTGRERRQRAALAVRALMSNARRSIFLPLSAVLVSLGALFFALPKATAYAFGILCGWLAISAWDVANPWAVWVHPWPAPRRRCTSNCASTPGRSIP